MRKFLLLFLCLSVAASQLLAQSRTIRGRVTDQANNPVANVSIVVKGTNTGTKTIEDGTFTLSVPASAQTLVVSSLNFSSREISLGDKTDISIQLTGSSADLQEVVVTSLGITRDKRSLGYATQTIRGDQLADRGEVNVINSLQGKVSGVSITNASGGAGASVNINIRGITSFTGSNQPLFVVDGIPISNDVDRTNGGTLGTLGDNQPANRAIDLDLGNIESVNVLKGAAASVLYGSRAAAGAIIITTKKGGSGKNNSEITFNSSYSIQQAIGLPQVQNSYGQGTNGAFLSTTGLSWGPKFGTTPTIANGLIVNGTAVPYQAYPNNIKDFFNQNGAGILDNSLTINSGDAKQNFSFSISNLNQNGILPNTDFKRTSIKFGGNTILRNKVRLGSSVTLINSIQDGILDGNGAGSAIGVLAGFARSIDLTGYKTHGTYVNPDGSNNFVLPSTDNPYFDAYQNTLKSNLYRVIGNFNVGFDINSWLNVSYRLGVDVYTDRRKQVFAVSAANRPTGQVLENMLYRSEVNGDLIITAKKNNIFTKDLNLTAFVGQNINQRTFQSILIQGDALAFPSFYNVSNATILTNGTAEATTLQRLVGYYAQASFAYKNYLFLEGTARVDQSSTLPLNKNSFFYPSVSAGFVFTDALNMKSSVLNYGKIRASIATVGRDATPYLLSNVYVTGAYGNNVASFNFPYGSVAGFGASTRISPATLSPEFTTSYEFGVNLGLFKNRISLDLTYFNSDSKDQIINVAIPYSTGYATKTTNIGELSNKGVEALVNLNIVTTKNFKWDGSFNFTKIVNKVISIAPGVDNFAVPGNAFTGSIPSIKVGYGYGVILGGVIPVNPADGQRLINPSTGLYQTTIANQVLADPNPDYKLGFTNNLRYKNFSLGFTFDFTKGGQILSFTSAIYKSRGAWIGTEAGRDQPHILPGEIQNGTKFTPNNIQIPAQTYWGALGGLQSEFNVYDATVFRLREVSFGYDLPVSVTQKLKIGPVRFSLFARNVFFIAPNSIIDPEVNTQGAGNIRGLELQGTPNARTIGANVKISL